MQSLLPLSYYLAELHTLSTLPPNTYLHKNRDDHFIATADFNSNIKGAQTLANLYKGHSPEKTAEDISTFAESLIERIHEEKSQENVASSREVFRKIIFINQSINQALKGKISGGGLRGLAETYTPYPSCKTLLENSIEGLKNEAFAALKALRDLIPEKEFFDDEKLAELSICHVNPPAAPYCPEEDYNDGEWEAAIKNSADLKSEMMGMFQYYGRYSIGLFYNQSLNFLSGILPEAKGWDWWNKIGDFENGSVYLGALPLTTLKGKDDLKSFQELGIQAVLSVVEVFENHSDGFLTSPIKPEDYAACAIKHLQIPSPDCQTILFELILRGVAYIHWNVTQGRNVIVHCKAGRGRSALTVMCYLIKHHHYGAEQAFLHVQSKRPQVNFSRTSGEWKTLELFEEFYSKS